MSDMPVCPSEEEIALVLAHFQEIAPKIRQHNVFGDSNREKIDIQIEVLKSRKDVVEGLWSDYDEACAIAEEEGDDEPEEPNSDLISSADVAYEWLQGRYDEKDNGGVPFIAYWDELLPEA